MSKAIDDAMPPPTGTKCQVFALVLIGLALAIWGAYVLIARLQGESVSMEILAAGPAGAVLLARALLPSVRRRSGGGS